MKAYCWASGEVGFGNQVPEGAIFFAEGEGETFKERIQVLCRLAYPTYKNGVKQRPVWLVPGIPEAENEKEALEALYKFKDWLDTIEKQSQDQK